LSLGWFALAPTLSEQRFSIDHPLSSDGNWYDGPLQMFQAAVPFELSAPHFAYQLVLTFDLPYNPRVFEVAIRILLLCPNSYFPPVFS